MLKNKGDKNENFRRTKNVVKEKYGEIAKASPGLGCCGPVSSCCGDNKNLDSLMIGDEYKNVAGYVAEADLGLGCGLPTEFAGIKKGDTVVDLGSGAGNDVFVSRAIVGDEGKVIGIDMTEPMIEKLIRTMQNLDIKMLNLDSVILKKYLLKII